MVNKKLFQIIANYYSFYLMVHTYHWNVKGSNFLSIHKLLDSMYKDLIEEIDEIAERMRILGDEIEISFDKISSYSSIKAPKNKLSEKDMIKDLLSAIKELEELIKEALEDYNEIEDLVTVDLLTQKLSKLEKDKWFLNSVIS